MQKGAAKLGKKIGQKIGYARVSTCEQNLDLQLDALEGAECDQVFIDQRISEMALELNELSEAFNAVLVWDTLVVHKLDRMREINGLPGRANC